MYWVLYATLWGTIYQLWQFAIEFQPSVQTRSNNTHLDFIIHTGCDLVMLTSAILAYRFPKLWDYVGLIWFSMYCTYHYFTAILEGNNFSQIRLLTADLMCYYVIVIFIINSSYWIIESVIGFALFGITCYLMASSAISNSLETCSSFGLLPTDEGFENCTLQFGGDKAWLFSI
jgi:hypothetical protein